MMVRLALEFHRRAKRRRPGRRGKNELPDVIGLDGKTVRGAIRPGKSKSDTHIVNAVCGLVTMAVRKVAEKSNEIKAFPIILDALRKYGLLAGKVITIDAMGCQRNLAGQIIDGGANYLFSLKGNQGGLLEEVTAIFDALVKYGHEFISKVFISPAEKVAGRVETRSITVIDLSSATMSGWLTRMADWAGLKTALMVERHVEHTDGKPPSREVRYYVSSLNLAPSKMLELVIGHWTVETMHSVLDEVENYAEDRCKICRGNGAEILSIMRKLGYNFLIQFQNFHANATTGEINVIKESVREILGFFRQCIYFSEAVLTRKPDEVGPIQIWEKHMGTGAFANLEPILPPVPTFSQKI
jgi:predicted transposase YbfD/YdcC